MREGWIVLPTGDDAAHSWLRRRAAAEFGGYTATNTFGGWMAPNGELIEEPGIRYRIALDPKNAGRLRLIAIEAGRRANQQAVYVRLPSEEVEIITL